MRGPDLGGHALGERGADIRGSSRRVSGKTLREANAAEVVALVKGHAARPPEDQLGRAAADIDDERVLLNRPAGGDAAEREQRLFVAREEARLEAVAPFDLAEKRLPVLGVPDGACREGERALGTELLHRAAVVGEDVSDAHDSFRQQLPADVHTLAKARYLEAAVELADDSVLDVRHEEPCRVRAEIDDSDARHLRSVFRALAERTESSGISGRWVIAVCSWCVSFRARPGREEFDGDQDGGRGARQGYRVLRRLQGRDGQGAASSLQAEK